MNKQPEALRLAECLNGHEYCSFVQMDDAASELRRLHELNIELLEALKAADWYIGQLEPFVYGADDNGVHEEHAKVRAAITKATGEQL